VFSVLCSTDDTSFHVFGTLFHWWQQFSCFRYSAPPLAPVFMFSVFCSSDVTCVVMMTSQWNALYN
jgi:hypothetical protein